jgi:hypothetical protein
MDPPFQQSERGKDLSMLLERADNETNEEQDKTSRHNQARGKALQGREVRAGNNLILTRARRTRGAQKKKK